MAEAALGRVGSISLFLFFASSFFASSFFGSSFFVLYRGTADLGSSVRVSLGHLEGLTEKSEVFSQSNWYIMILYRQSSV